MNNLISFHRKGCLLFLLIALSCSASPAATQMEGDWATMKLTWSKPDDADKALANPIANGHIAAKIRGGIATETIYLNNKTFWSGWPVAGNDPKRRDAMLATRKALAAGDYDLAETEAKGMQGNASSASYLPLGNLLVDFNHGATATDYERSLDLDRALSTVRYKVGDVIYTRESFASFPDHIIVMRLTASQPGQLTFTTRLENPAEMGEHGSVGVEGNDILIMKGRAPGNDLKTWDPLKGTRHETRVRIIPQGGQLSADASTNSISVKGADSVVFHIADETSYHGYDKEPGTEGLDPALLVRADLQQVAMKSYDQLLAAHLADYQPLFRRVWLTIDEKSALTHVLNYQYMRYEMIATSRDGDVPHNLLGMWSHVWNGYSGAQYFLNENVQKYYAIIETGNIAETGSPLWKWMSHVAANGTQTAQIDWGFKGWMVGHSTDIWASTPLRSGNNEWAIWPTGGIWLCQNLWDHYAFSGDKTFLREQAYPVLKGAAEFALDYLVEDKDGTLVTSPSTSPENRFALEDRGKAYAVTVGSTIDMACIRELFENLVIATKTLDIDPELRTRLEATLPRLKPYQISQRESSKGELQEWAVDHSRLPEDPRRRYTPQRHSSHLVAVWPLHQITDKNPELFAAAKLALDNRGQGGYHPDKAAMYARLKEGDKALQYIGGKGHKTAGLFGPVYSSLIEMLVQSHTGEIELLPALPSGWKSGAISGVRARGGYQLAIAWKDGELVKCDVVSQFKNPPIIRYKGKLLTPADPRIKLTLASVK